MGATRASRALIALALAFGVVTAGGSSAQVARCTPVAVDPAGDQEPGVIPGDTNRPDLDLRALDLGGDARTLVVTIKTEGTDTMPLPPRLTDVVFDIKGDTYNAYKYVGPEGTIYGFNNADGSHAITGSTDARTNIVRLRIPVHLLRARAGDLVINVAANTEELLGVNALASGHMRDSAGGRRSYRLGSRGCI